MASGHDQSKEDKSDTISKAISRLRKFFINFSAGTKKDRGGKSKQRTSSKKYQTNVDLLKNEPDIMLLDKDKIRTSVRIYRDHPPDFPTTEQIKARLIAAEKYYGIPRTVRPVGEGMVFEEDAQDVVQIRPSWAYILERPLVEQYVLMSNYIRRLSAMSEMTVPDDRGYVEEEFRDDDFGDGTSCVTGRSSLSYLGSMCIRPATAPSDKEDEPSVPELAESPSIPAIEPVKANPMSGKSSIDNFYPILDDENPETSYEKQEFEVTYPTRTSLVVPEKDLSRDSSIQKVSGSRDSFLDFRNMRVEEIPEQKFQVVMERTAEIKSSRMLVDESLTLNQQTDDNNQEKTRRHTVRFACPPNRGGGVSRIARIFEESTVSSPRLNRVSIERQESIQIHEGNLLSGKNVVETHSKRIDKGKKPVIERISLSSFSGSESGNDSPDDLSN